MRFLQTAELSLTKMLSKKKQVGVWHNSPILRLCYILMYIIIKLAENYRLTAFNFTFYSKVRMSSIQASILSFLIFIKETYPTFELIVIKHLSLISYIAFSDNNQ